MFSRHESEFEIGQVDSNANIEANLKELEHEPIKIFR